MSTYNTVKFLLYTLEAINHFGYIKSYNDFSANTDSTWRTAQKFYNNDLANFDEKNPEIENEKIEIGFNPNKTSNELFVEDAIRWILSEKANNDYMIKLQSSVKSDTITNKELGIVASLIPTYQKHISYTKQKEEEANRMKSLHSEFVGKIGERIIINVKSVELVTSWDSEFGICFLYRIIDMNDNIFIWKTGNVIGDDCIKLQGTIKDHSTYNGIKQNIINRCKEIV